MNYRQILHDRLQTLSPRRRWALIAGLSIIILMTSGIIIWLMSPNYGVLFSHVDKNDANQIITQLEQANIEYVLRNNGADILIDKALIDKTRIKLMSSDVSLSHTVGFELFDKTDFGMTDFSQKMNYQRALQGELERTITSLDEVKQARVQLTLPESHLFQPENNLPRAAVTLHLVNPLNIHQIKSIQQLIAASVAHLPVTNVVILDQKGNGLTLEDDDINTTHFAAKKSIERYLNGKVMQMLTPIFNDKPIMVKIDATLNYDELQRERIKPQQEGVVSHEKEVRHAPTNTHNQDEKKPINQDISRERSYQLGRETENFTRANGTIERLTISVVLPENTPNKTKLQIERLVKSVVGFNEKRGDSISVEALTRQTSNPVMKMTSAPKRYTPKDHAYLEIAIIILLFLALMHQVHHRRARKKQRQDLLNELHQWLLDHDKIA
jgi:flagellar M-ring protein FliF